MDIAELTSFVTGLLGEEDKDLKVGPTMEICSGGRRETDRDEFPVLYISKDHAVSDWIGSFEEELGAPIIRWKWVDKPAFKRFQITIMDMHQLQRLSQDRWTVTGKLMYATAEAPNASAPVKESKAK